jgi:hypothetical protein
MWNSSPRKPRIAQFGGSFPFSKFMTSLYSLTRKQSSIILQLRCGHIPLNAYLNRINKSDTDRCPVCDLIDPGNSPRETVNHFLFDCPAHEVAREEFTDKLDGNHLHLSDIITDADRMKDLVTFVNRTRSSVWKSSPGTGQRPRLDRTKTGKRPDRRSSLSYLKYKDRKKTGPYGPVLIG